MKLRKENVMKEHKCIQDDRIETLERLRNIEIEKMQKCELIIQQNRCVHRELLIQIERDGYVWGVECAYCKKSFGRVSGWGRRFSAKRVYRMFIK